MPIPDNITRKHILRAIARIDKEGVPKNRKIRKYYCEYEMKKYPPKLLISYANVFANKEELDWSPKVFNTYMAQKYLESKEFKIN